MDKREEIREGMRLIWNDYKFGDHINKPDSVWVVDEILTYLDSMGVVIKVDRVLPKYHGSARVFLHEAYPIVQKELIKTGYVATESLIKE